MEAGTVLFGREREKKREGKRDSNERRNDTSAAGVGQRMQRITSNRCRRR